MLWETVIDRLAQMEPIAIVAIIAVMGLIWNGKRKDRADEK